MARDVDLLLGLHQAPRQAQQLQHEGLVLVEQLLEVVLDVDLLLGLHQAPREAHHVAVPVEADSIKY